jgi:filamin
LSKFTIDARDAGDGGLGFSVEGPSKAELNCISKEDGTCQVEFLPKTPGVYTIHIKYADQHVPGSPFTCVVAGEDGTLPEEVCSTVYTRKQSLSTRCVPTACSQLLTSLEQVVIIL